MAAYLVDPGQPTRTSSLVRHSGLQKLGRTCFHSTQEAKPAPLPFPSAAPQNPLKILRPPPPSSVAKALARRLLRLRPHLGTLPLPSPNSSHLLGTRTYISDMRRSAFVDRLLRSVRSEISFLNNSAPPPSAPPPTPFTVEDRPGEQWARLRRVFPAAEGEEEEVRVDATLVDGALPPSRSGADTGGPPRLHISVKVEVSKAARPGVVLTFECSAWPDEMEVRRVFPVRRGGPALVQQYVGRQFSELDEEMQSAVQDYLEQIGVNDDLAAFLHAYMENKEHTELIRWLKNVECHIKK